MIALFQPSFVAVYGTKFGKVDFLPSVNLFLNSGHFPFERVTGGFPKQRKAQERTIAQIIHAPLERWEDLPIIFQGDS